MPRRRQSASSDCRSAPYEQFFNRLIDQVNPRQPAHNGSVSQARIYAGRWLALRRIRCGLSNHQIEDRTGIVPPTLLLLETGLADDTLAPAEAWEQLGTVLAGRRGVEPHVAAVVDVALGRANTMRSSTMAQVGNDLRLYDRAPRDVLARTLRKHRKGLALLGLLASAVAFWRRHPLMFRRAVRGLYTRSRSFHADRRSQPEPTRSQRSVAPAQAAVRRSHADGLHVPIASLPLKAVKPIRQSDQRRFLILLPGSLLAGAHHEQRAPSCSKKRHVLARGLAAQRRHGISIDFRLKLSRGGL